MTPIADRKYLSADEMEIATGIKKSTWRKWVHLGKVKHYKCGRRVLFDLAEVLAQFRAQQAK